ncbi:iron-binding zinc finger protein, CDGSH type [Ochromonadaceae sp. CCMP2298]|nr:iron-binding zinc finger protein, CDGSH type [Ochromonadaceae sp. CCMP2298]
MATPTIADKQPKRVELEAGKTYAWCACGQSSNQPFCDGSHKGTEFEPKVFKAEETKTVSMCMCKHTKNPGFCDGSHKAL